MEEMYGLHSPPSDYTYSYQNHPPPLPMMPDAQMLSPPAYYHAAAFSSFRDRIPVLFGSEQLFSGSDTAAAVSDAASIVASDGDVSIAMRSRVASHPLYPKLLEAYIDCQKVGAPPEIAYLLDELRRESDISRRSTVTLRFGADPELDDFMESYCDILQKYKSDLARPFDEATMFLNNIEIQLNTLCNNGSSRNTPIPEDAAVSSSEELRGADSMEIQESQHTSVERELKDNLLRKYSGYITTLKNEFSKKKKKGKLPREARQTLLEWWNVHYKWPYPTEVDKITLAESTGLDQKQINNWFINQRKRHWKPSENMQFAVMDSLYGTGFHK